MLYKHFGVNIIIRVLLIIALSFALSIVFLTKKWEWAFTLIVITSLIIIITLDLIFYINKTNRDLTYFLLSIKQGEFTGSFTGSKRGKSYHKLNEAYNEIIQEFRKINLQKESHYQYLQTVNENIGVAILSFRDDETLVMINPAAKKMFGKPYLSRLDDLGKIDTQLPSIIRNLESGDRELLKMVVDGSMEHISIHAKEFVLQNEKFKLILLQNIHSEMEQKEVEAWQKLISVLTHEIMNSVTPIVSLIAAINSILVNEEGKIKQLSNLHSDDMEDLYSSLQTIKSRSNGLLKFVNAYKDFSKTPDMHISEFDVKESVDNICSLLAQDLEKNNIKLYLESTVKNPKTKADKELIDQVLINLLKNAIEAVSGKPDATIKILISRSTGKKLKIIVSDNGPGMDVEIQEKIFIPFYTTKKEGTGVGLSLSKQIMKLHGGSISLKTKSGAGTQFSLEF